MAEYMDTPTTEKFLEVFEGARVIAVDTETTGLQVKDGRDYLQGISIATRMDGFGYVSAYFAFRHKEDNLNDPIVFERVKAIVESKPSIYHNLKFDLHSLATIGIAPGNTCYDTLTLAHMVNENWPSKKLDWLSKLLLDDEKDTKWIDLWSKQFGWGEIPTAMMAPYAKQDAELTYRLFEKLWPMIKQQNLEDLWPVEFPYLKLLTKIENTGMLVNQDFCKEKISIGLDTMNNCRKQLGFNPGSTIDLNKFLIEELKLPMVRHTPGSCIGPERCSHVGSMALLGTKPSFDKYAMELYDIMLEHDNRDEAKLILTYRGWQKSTSSFYESLLKLVSPDGRVRPDFKLHGTRTGRNSCEKPNLQQIPRESKYPWNGDAKNALITEDGFIPIEFDYAQLEFRLATAYGQDKVLLDAFDDPTQDVFIPIAESVFGNVEFRQKAKTTVYSTLFGGGVPRLMIALGLDEDGAKRVWSTFRESYPGLYEKSKLASRNVERFGYVKYWTGRKRHLRKDDSHKAFNAAVQGGAAEIVKRSMLRVAESICNSDCRMVLTVHDSIVLEVKTELVEDVTARVIPLMTDWDFGVKFAVDAHVWGAKE